MDVIIFSGQSNMQGQSECLTENDVVNDAYEYKWLTDELLPLIIFLIIVITSSPWYYIISPQKNQEKKTRHLA